MAIIEIGKEFGKRIDGVQHRKQAIIRAPCGPVFVYETSVTGKGEEIKITRVGQYRGDAEQGQSGYLRRIAGEIQQQHRDNVARMLRKLGYADDVHFLQ